MSAGIEKLVETIDSIPKVNWDFEGIHYFDNGPLTVQYLLVLDALNFCFWPGMLCFSFFYFFVSFMRILMVYRRPSAILFSLALSFCVSTLF